MAGVKRFSWPGIAGMLVSVAMALVMMTSLAPASVSAAEGYPSCDKPTFFGLETWYAYLPYGPNSTTQHCEINESADKSNVLGTNSFILLIVLAVIDDLLRIAGMVAIAFVIAGGFKFITSQGEPEAAASARKTLLFALVGLAVALIAVVIVSFIGSSIGQ